jgi:hypothetical protein
MLPVPSHASNHPSLISPFFFRPNNLTFPPLQFHGASPSLFVVAAVNRISGSVIFCPFFLVWPNIVFATFRLIA